MSKNKKLGGVFKESLKIRQMSVRELCVMAMLVAITFGLSYISGFLRIGNSIKFSISFISVYIGGAMFGPIAGGIIAALADVISFLSNPTGPFVPIFTVMEFVNGMLFGLFMFRPTADKRPMWHALVLIIICALLQFCVNMFWRTYELARMYYGGHFMPLFISRIPTNVILIVCKIAVVLLLEPYIPQLTKMIRKEK